MLIYTDLSAWMNTSMPTC